MKLNKSYRKFIRRRKSEIRRLPIRLKEEKELINKLYEEKTTQN